MVICIETRVAVHREVPPWELFYRELFDSKVLGNVMCQVTLLGNDLPIKLLFQDKQLTNR